MLKRIALAVSLATMLVLPACNKSNEPAPQTVAASGVKFQLEASTDEDFLKALTYDESNRYQVNGITSYRLLAGEVKKSHVLVFSRPTSRATSTLQLEGYVELQWTLSKNENGSIKASCYGDYKVYQATVNTDPAANEGKALIINKDQEVTLLASKSYLFLGILSDAPLDNQIPQGGYIYAGPSVSFDSEQFSTLQGDALLKNMQGNIPYTFRFELTPQKENLVVYKSGGIINLGSTVVRVEVENNSNRPLTSSDIRFKLVGLTSRIKYAFMDTSMRPQLAEKTPYQAHESLTENGFNLPISSLPPKSKGVYFIPLTKSNGDARHEYLKRVEIKIDSPQSDLSVVSSNTRAPFVYTLNDVAAIDAAWLNSSQKKLKVIKLTVFSVENTSM
ncbi:MAG: hypothetical protein SOW66_05350 [Porphyromonas sp.]|nr:hypothetical protein [Porphyromonas sp.]